MWKEKCTFFEEERGFKKNILKSRKISKHRRFSSLKKYMHKKYKNLQVNHVNDEKFNIITNHNL